MVSIGMHPFGSGTTSGKSDNKPGPFAGQTLAGNGSAMALNNPLDDGKTQARSMGAFGSKKGFKNPFHHIRLNTRAGISHRYHKVFRIDSA